jgi:hypothetical protein
LATRTRGSPIFGPVQSPAMTNSRAHRLKIFSRTLLFSLLCAATARSARSWTWAPATISSTNVHTPTPRVSIGCSAGTGNDCGPRWKPGGGTFGDGAGLASAARGRTAGLAPYFKFVPQYCAERARPGGSWRPRRVGKNYKPALKDYNAWRPAMSATYDGAQASYRRAIRERRILFFSIDTNEQQPGPLDLGGVDSESRGLRDNRTRNDSPENTERATQEDCRR